VDRIEGEVRQKWFFFMLANFLEIAGNRLKKNIIDDANKKLHIWD
jgi:hypothetical protein